MRVIDKLIEKKKFIHSLFLLSCITYFGCFISNSLSENKQKVDSEDVILDIGTTSEGMMYPSGEILNIKLFDSGKFEYDFYPIDPVDPNTVKIERKSNILGDKDLEKVKRLIENLKKQSYQSEYAPKSLHFDVAIKMTVKFKKNGNTEVIMLNENDSNLHLDEKKGIYPDSLLNLLLYVEDLNERLLSNKAIEQM